MRCCRIWQPISFGFRLQRSWLAERLHTPRRLRPRVFRLFFSTGSDPVQLGLVESLNRPGGNATGTVQFNDTLITKRLELLRELVPAPRVVGVMADPRNPTVDPRLASIEAAAASIGQKLRIFTVTSQDQFEAVFATIVQEGIAALLVSNGTLFTNNRERLVALAARYAVPTAYEYREFVEAGGLFSYGSSNSDSYNQVGLYVGRILKGESPAEMPVVLPTKFEFVLNLKTAKSLRLDVPLKLHAFADEVIE
jgi:putative ABC transport system substrate-binding protein